MIAENRSTMNRPSDASPVNGLLGLWHDCSESPGREEDGQVLRYVIYSRSQVKRFASNLQGDFILEIHPNAVVRPRSRHGIAERTELVDRLPRQGHDLQPRLAVQRRRHPNEPLDVRGDRLVRLPALDDPVQGDAAAFVDSDGLQFLHESDDQVSIPIGEGLDLTFPQAVDAPDDPRLRLSRLEQILV